MTESLQINFRQNKIFKPCSTCVEEKDPGTFKKWSEDNIIMFGVEINASGHNV